MKYIVFGRPSCPYCVKAQKLLEYHDLTYKMVNFEQSQASVLNEIKSAYDWKTVPMVFLRDGAKIEFIGGFTDLKEHLKIHG